VQTAPSIDQVDLNAYLGPCQVIDCRAAAARSSRLVLPDDLGQVWDKKIPRVLFRTAPGADPNMFPADFVAIAPETMDYLGTNGCVLVGIDTPSIDPFTSKDLRAHNRLYANKIMNLEGLDLTHAAPGLYELIALPLRLVGFDASPVRAILRRYHRD
jgi:arylformamidase